jgi:putative transposase
VESFFKTLKYEEVYLNEYETFDDALENIGRFIEDVYNAERMNSALGYLSPIEFELQEENIYIVA